MAILINIQVVKLQLIVMLITMVSIVNGFSQTQKVKVYTAPRGEILSLAYKVSVLGRQVPVYKAKIGAADNNLRFKAVDDLMNSERYFDNAAFCHFDMQGSVNVRVNVNYPVKRVKVLPASAGIKAIVHQRSISFNLSSPQNLTIEINGEVVKSLHLFANPIETDVPKANDPNVIYFGPGVHHVSSMVIGDNKTVYISGGAIIRAVIGKNEKFTTEPSGLRNYPPTFIIAGRNIKFRGRGIIDASACTTHSRNILYAQGADINLEGIILRDPSVWTIFVRQCDRISINNIKILGYRANSDGIDICNSRNVTVQNCFVRTNDDLIVVKSFEDQGPVSHVVVKNCTLWNQLAHALSLGAELREDVSDVLFTNCDIIHDTSREWAMRIFHSDASLISNIKFENVRVEESRQLISLWIGKTASTFEKGLGNIQGVSFKNIKAYGSPLAVQLTGGDNEHGIKDVTFEHVLLNNKPLNNSRVTANEFIKNISIRP